MQKYFSLNIQWRILILIAFFIFNGSLNVEGDLHYEVTSWQLHNGKVTMLRWEGVPSELDHMVLDKHGKMINLK